jgi:hypothetical protein
LFSTSTIYSPNFTDFRANFGFGEGIISSEIEWPEDDEYFQTTRDILIICGEIENDENLEIDENRYVKIVPPDSSEKWKWMEEFTLFQVSDSKLQNKLANALGGRKPFRHFKDVLLNFPKTREQWFAFESEKLREYIEK